MSTKTPDLSLVILAFNEEASLRPFVEECLVWLDSMPGCHDVVIVDDGSTDATQSIASQLANEDGRVHVVRHGVNRGMGAGMRSGIEAARGEYFVMLPADGQIPVSAIDVLLPALRNAEIVTSVYTRRPSEHYRVLMSKGLRALMRLSLGLTFALEGIYLFPISVAKDEIGLDNIASSTFFFSFELIARALMHGYRIDTVTIEPRPRSHGESKVANWKRIRRVSLELLRFRRRLRQESRTSPQVHPRL